MKRAQILLMADSGATDGEVAHALVVGTSTVYRTRRRFVEGGLDFALRDRTHPGGTRKLSPQDEAILVAVACSEPPTGRARWTLQLIADRLVALTDHDSVSIETIRRRLREKELKPWQKATWCIPKVDADFVANMEDVLDLYAEPPDADFPVVCFDETMTQLVQDVRDPLPMRPGSVAKVDYEYRRNGIAHLLVSFDRHRGWRHVEVTRTRTCVDFAHAMRDLVDVHYPDARRIRVVLDNLNVHRTASLYKAFPAAEARRIARRLEFHFTPKHASWLNMVEIEIGILARQCLDRRIGDIDDLRTQVAAWNLTRNEQRASIRWLFDVDAARSKLGRAYPSLSL